MNVICNKHDPALRIDYCTTEKYFCIIVDGPPGPAPPNEAAFIEWYYQIPYGVVGPESHITGKMTFSASADYINNWYNGSNYATSGPAGLGIPMFVQPSHNEI
jgi:hypothetical protein